MSNTMVVIIKPIVTRKLDQIPQPPKIESQAEDNPMAARDYG